MTSPDRCVILKLWKREYTRSAEVGWVLLYPADGRISSERRGEEYTGLIEGIGFGVFTCILYLTNVRKSMDISHKMEILLFSQNGDRCFMNYDKLEFLAKEKGVSKTFLCQIVGRERYYLRDCKKNCIVPPDEYVEAWANALGSSVAYLMDETDDPSPTKKEPVQALSEEEEVVLQILRTMSIEQKLNLIEYLKGM